MPQSTVTLRDVASLANVHPATVSRALNEETRRKVNGETAQRVLRAAEQLGYRINPIARSLRTSRSLTVGVLIPDLTNPFYPPIVRGVEDELNTASYVAVLGNTDNDAVKERRVFETLRDRQVDGFIVMTAKRRHPLIVEAAAQDLPLVLVSRDVEGCAVSGVMLDDEAAMAMSVAHLVSLGHRRIAHVSGPRSVSTAVRRRLGFLAATRADPSVSTTVVESASFSIEAGREACLQLLQGTPDVTAVVAANDMIALGCLAAAQQLGVDCPGRVSVVGVNDSPLLDRTNPSLSTISVPKYEMGRSAAQLLLSQLSPDAVIPRSVERRQMQPSLVVRNSTGPAPVLS